jgi:hypothetical protein
MGYRQSNFDPLAVNREVHPIVRPFDRWQWFGVFAEVVALALVLLWLAGLAKLLPAGLDFDSMAFALPFFLGGTFLLRRDPGLAPGELGDRKWQLIAILLGFALLPFAFV